MAGTLQQRVPFAVEGEDVDDAALAADRERDLRSRRPLGRPRELSRDQLMQSLLDHGIGSRRGIMNSHQEAAYAAAGPYHLPHSEAARDNVLLLPLFHSMTAEEQGRVIDHLLGVAHSRGSV